MALKKYKPITAGTRWRIGNAYAEITTNKPEKSLLEPQKNTAGRNFQGRRVMRYMGGGNKQHYRIIDFKRNKRDITATVVSIEYDPNRTSFIALLQYTDGEKRYIIAPNGLQVGANVIAGDEVAPEIGNALVMKNMPLGTMIHNIELQPGQGAKLARSAGSYAVLTAKEGNFVSIKLPSGEVRKVIGTCTCVIGRVGNEANSQVRIGKAGRMRKMGIRPSVRGKAMNAKDHPHGGGRGRSPIGMKFAKTPWGKHAMGVKTRGTKKTSNVFIVSRRKKKQ